MNKQEINDLINARVYRSNSMLFQAVSDLQEAIHIVQITKPDYIKEGTKAKAQYGKLEKLIDAISELNDEVGNYWSELVGD